MRISVLKLENAFLRQLLQGKKDENTLKTLRAGNADAADITRQEFRLPAGRAERIRIPY